MLVSWLGALLVLIGVVFMATQAIRQGRLSEPKLMRSSGATLEPQRPGAGFGLKSNWPGLVLIAIGAVLLLARVAF